MIDNHEQLAVVRRQLALAEDALVSLHQRLHAKNRGNYAIYAESYIDMILKLRAEIDAFLEIAPPTAIPAESGGAVDDEQLARPR
jgi:hypothetical protein